MNIKTIITMIVIGALLPIGCQAQASEKHDAVYLGVQNYGEENTNKDNKQHFLYRFDTDGEESVYSIDNGTRGEDGEFDYPIQNMLKEGYLYQITVDDGTVVAAVEKDARKETAVTPVSGTPGKRTLKNFLQTALMPVGTTLYIYGGGWDWQDVGSSIQTRTLGVSPDWIRFFDEHDETYTYKSKDGNEDNRNPRESYYPYGGYNEYYYAGLDCSGYLGWTLYNTFEAENGREGYVIFACDMAKDLSERGWGAWTQHVSIPDGSEETVVPPGSVMSMDGHVWISLGTCADGSVVIVHSTPTNSRAGQPGGGVQIGAISRGADQHCEAYSIAEKVMSTYYPGWYERYDTAIKDAGQYFEFEYENAGLFIWDTSTDEGGLLDPDGIQEMTPSEVLQLLFD